MPHDMAYFPLPITLRDGVTRACPERSERLYTSLKFTFGGNANVLTGLRRMTEGLHHDLDKNTATQLGNMMVIQHKPLNAGDDYVASFFPGDRPIFENMLIIDGNEIALVDPRGEARPGADL